MFLAHLVAKACVHAATENAVIYKRVRLLSTGQ